MTETGAGVGSGKPDAVALVDKVDFLSATGSYPSERPEVVEARETHMSWVFLTDRFVYKLKKPVRHAHADLRALEARRRNCLTEMRLNRRLAPDVYLAMKPLTFAAHHGLQLAGDGDVVDWLVTMRRLPEELMLDHALRSGGPEPRDLNRIALRLTRFYGGLAPEPITPEERCIWLEEEIRLSRQELARPAFARDKALVDRVAGRLIDFLHARPEMLIERHRSGRIVEGHGDLRPEHICLAHEPIIIDCLEFSRALRLVDPADELAFLALECAMLGEPEAGVRLQRSYETFAADRPPEQLLAGTRGVARSSGRGFRLCTASSRERVRRRLGWPKPTGTLLWRVATPRRSPEAGRRCAAPRAARRSAAAGWPRRQGEPHRVP